MARQETGNFTKRGVILMGRARASKVVGLCAAVLIGLIALSAVGTSASSPPSHTVSTPAAPGTTTVTWTGTIPPGIGPTSDCNTAPPGDSHQIKLQVPAGFYDAATSSATFKISWNDDTNDEILTVNGPDGDEVGSSDGSGASEVVSATDLKAGNYEVLACGFAAPTPQDYTGELTLATASLSGEATPPSADPQGLSFSASVPADPQRDEAEPDMRIDGDGNIYTCGPTGFSGSSDYAQISTDGGDQFHLLGEDPRGQQGSGGGGDCGLAMGVERNAQGAFQYAYAGLGPLTGFTTSTSPDNGHTITTAGPQGNTNTAQGGGADRQWLTFLDDKTVLLSYNQQAPRNIVVQKSIDGGLTYLPGNDTVSSPNPDFPGPMRTMPARFVNPGQAGNIAYYGWNSSDADFSYVNFAISDQSGLNWSNCVVQKIPVTDTGGLGAFTVADNDEAGNIYLTYSDEKAFHSYLTTLTADKLAGCTDGTADQPTTDPGWSKPVQIDRGAVRTTVFPWLAAGGEPGRVAIAFYGTETDGDPNAGTFKASWDVYVTQSLDALSANPAVSQVKATTHPFHYDSICLRGLSCDLSQPPGDRSLADFFSIAYNERDGRLSIVYDQGAKMPDEAVGHVATPAVITQEAGPSNGGGTLTARREVLRKSSEDATGDATADYSSLFPNSSSPSNAAAMDFVSQSVGREVRPGGGELVPDGGFTVTLKLADLSGAALSDALSKTKSGSLLWVFRFVNGYQASAASARWSPGGGFSFGYNDYTTGSAQCGSDNEKCQVYPGDQPLKGKVDQEAGTITLSVPRNYLNGLAGPTGSSQRPTLDKARPGTRFYDATAFSLGNLSPDPTKQSFLYPIDNPPAMDFVLPGPGVDGDDTPTPHVPGPCENQIPGTEGKDRLKGGSGSEKILGRGGNDRLSGRGGDDCIKGQGGNDRLAGGGGDDAVNGGPGRDRLGGGGGDDSLKGGAGRDKLKGGAGNDTLQAGRGKDRISAGGGRDVIRARNGGPDTIDCGPGKDTVYASRKADRVRHCERIRTG